MPSASTLAPMSINPVDLAAAAEGILNTQYLLQRERLLSASAQASRLLLEAPDAIAARIERFADERLGIPERR